MRIETIALRRENPNVTLTTYIIDDSPEMLNGANRPAILVCPGGGILYCSDREGEPIALRYAAMGYHAFVLRYSCYFSSYSETQYANGIKRKEGVGFPHIAQDVALAMEYISDHADEYHLDRDRIAISGFSGGALTAALYCVYWNKDIIKNILKSNRSYKPAAMVLGYGVYDNTVSNLENDILGYKDLNNAFLIALTGTANPDIKVRTSVSPALLIDSEVPPTFLWSTYEDDAVPIQQTIEMARALIKGGIPTELHIFESGFHGLALATQATGAAKDNIAPDIAIWIDLADRWLGKRFALPLPENMTWNPQF